MLTGRPAAEMLALPGEALIAWAAFDYDWYARRYRDDLAGRPERSPQALLGYYLAVGARLGHAPNRYFDETLYRARYPGVAQAIAAGEAESGFDHYCRTGHAALSPHILFDEATYRALYADLTDEVLAAHAFANGYDHYLKHGSVEGRIGHALLDPPFYRAALPAEQRAAAEQIGAFAHCVAQMEASAPETPASPFLDPAFYAGRYAGSTGGGWALAHYLANATPTEFDPVEAFSEDFYLARYPDIAAAVAAGERRNGYQHFLSEGAREGRTPHPQVDLAWYVRAHPSVAEDLAHGRAPHAFAHYLAIGRPAGLPVFPPAEAAVDAQSGRSLFRARARALLPLWPRAPLDFTCDADAALSVIMVLHGQFALTMMALASLRANFAGAIELILVDSGSTDETLSISRYVQGARLLRFDVNIGFVQACNAGLYSVTTPYLLFLNTDIELAHGAVGALLRRFDDPRVGAVGGKLLRAHGVLQEAGGIVWRNGETEGYMRDASPLCPEANFVRDVDYCSGALLMVRADLLTALDGFDPAYAPAYYEDVDLCVRIAGRGGRVVYEPAAVATHLEYGSAPSAAAAEMLMGQKRTYFVERHAAWLQGRPEMGERLLARTRAAGPEGRPRRVLLIEDRLPLRALGSGFVRSNDIVRLLADQGDAVSVFPLFAEPADVAAVYADLPDTAEILHDRVEADLGRFLRERSGFYDVIWIARTHNLARFLAAYAPPPNGARARLVLDTEALGTVREWERGGLDPRADAAAFDAALRAELAGVETCDVLVAVSEAEAAEMRRLGLPNVHVLGHMREPRPLPTPWAEREGMLFVGAMHGVNSPNFDALCWFVDAVLPLLERELGWRTRLTVVGPTGDGVDLGRFLDHPRVTLRGPVADLTPLYASHLVLVAPTRFAAGLPYKVHEAASFGLPVVASELLVRQLGWMHGRDVIAAPVTDPAAFAAGVLALSQSEPLWSRVRSGAIDRLQRENGRDPYIAALDAVLGAAGGAAGGGSGGAAAPTRRGEA